MEQTDLKADGKRFDRVSTEMRSSRRQTSGAEGAFRKRDVSLGFSGFPAKMETETDHETETCKISFLAGDGPEHAPTTPARRVRAWMLCRNVNSSWIATPPTNAILSLSRH
jgi:hypothetical protein